MLAYTRNAGVILTKNYTNILTIRKHNLNALLLLLLFNTPTFAESGKALVKGQLMPCPDKPNCISTEQGDLEPIALNMHNPAQAWALLQSSIIELNGTIERTQDNYLWASFETPMFKFTDDVEARLDITHKVIHLRSASRKGYYDFNANQNRLNTLIKHLNNQLNPELLKNIHK